MSRCLMRVWSEVTSLIQTTIQSRMISCISCSTASLKPRLNSDNDDDLSSSRCPNLDYNHNILLLQLRYATENAIDATVALSIIRSYYNNKQESPAVARENALQPIQFLLQYGPSRSSKVDDFHVIRKSMRRFLLVINSNLSTLMHHLATIARNYMHTDTNI